MKLTELQQQFIKDLLKHKESEKSVIITQYYKYNNELVSFEFTIQVLLDLPLIKLLELVTPTKEGLISYYFPLF